MSVSAIILVASIKWCTRSTWRNINVVEYRTSIPLPTYWWPGRQQQDNGSSCCLYQFAIASMDRLRIFFFYSSQRPNRPWNPPSLLYFELYCRGWSARSVDLTTNLQFEVFITWSLIKGREKLEILRTVVEFLYCVSSGAYARIFHVANKDPEV
jgi:hypothetical protein